MDVSIEVDKSSTKTQGNSLVNDRLSNLPDDVTHCILSFLDATSAVQTSVLSKRWRNLWASLPVLNFHDEPFHDHLNFQDFVVHFLSRRNPDSSVSMLKFVCHDELDDGYVVDSIIDYVIPRGIQGLSILADCCILKLPQLSASQTLTTLELTDVATETTTFDLVSLQQLYLVDCKFECGIEEVLDPFRGCTNLKGLFLHDCQYYGEFERFKIYAPQLIDLSISCLRVDEEFDMDCVIELFTPKLQSFSYDDKDLYVFSIEGNLPFVEIVDIDVASLELTKELKKSDATNLSLKLMELFEVMGNAKFVSLSPGIIQVLSMFPGILVGRSCPFTRMQTFELIMEGSSLFPVPTNVMTYLFGGSPSFDF